TVSATGCESPASRTPTQIIATAVKVENIAMLEFVGIKIIGIIMKNTKISIDFVILTMWQFL
ncbi:MAG: hypothetical protein EB022_03130, partial [Proteobacteria bacterium]|nr:hypothetical protein [Pseudomonadota bacterium]